MVMKIKCRFRIRTPSDHLLLYRKTLQKMLMSRLSSSGQRTLGKEESITPRSNDMIAELSSIQGHALLRLAHRRRISPLYDRLHPGSELEVRDRGLPGPRIRGRLHRGQSVQVRLDQWRGSHISLFSGAQSLKHCSVRIT